MDKPLYSVIVNWNLAEETASCIQSLFAAGAQPGQIVVVDNGSQDNSPEKLSKQFGARIQLLASATNLGFAGGNNWAIQQILAQGAEWILLINNDTYVAPDFFQVLEMTVRQQPAYQIIGPLIFYHDEPTRIWSMGDRLIFGTLITRALRRNQIAPTTLAPFIEVDFLNACCILVHRSVFERIGLFDLAFFMYAEDADFCWRARQAGFKLGCSTQARLWHKVSRSTGPHHPAARYWRINNQIYFYRRYANVGQIPLMFLFTLLRSLKLATVDLLAGRLRLAQKTGQAWFNGWFVRSSPKVK
ncbi:MAG: glycosyltransferase family 2 protein [Caldilineaceae bacterium]